MHSRWRRPLELGREAPRRVLNVTQKDGANPPIDAVPSGPIAADLVLTGFVYQHSGAGGGVDFVNLGIGQTALSGNQSAQPLFAAHLAPPYGPGASGPAWFNHDKATNGKLEPMNTPLRNPAGFYHHVWQGSSFAGSSSTVALRAALPTDRTAITPTRVLPAPPAGSTARALINLPLVGLAYGFGGGVQPRYAYFARA